jgi:hypothetical protein
MKKCARCNKIKEHASWNPYYCKDCRNKRCRGYNKLPKNKIKRKEYNQKAILNGTHKIWNQKWRNKMNAEQKEVYYQKRRIKGREATKNLADECVKRALCKRNTLGFADITDELLVMQRAAMMLKRGIEDVKM